jgi:hypothetical protein
MKGGRHIFCSVPLKELISNARQGKHINYSDIKRKQQTPSSQLKKETNSITETSHFIVIKITDYKYIQRPIDFECYAPTSELFRSKLTAMLQNRCISRWRVAIAAITAAS